MSKKYQWNNPIAKVEVVTIPTWEYAGLIQHKTTLAIIVKLAKGLEEYQMNYVLKALFDRKEEVE